MITIDPEVEIPFKVSPREWAVFGAIAVAILACLLLGSYRIGYSHGKEAERHEIEKKFDELKKTFNPCNGDCETQ